MLFYLQQFQVEQYFSYSRSNAASPDNYWRLGLNLVCVHVTCPSNISCFAGIKIVFTDCGPRYGTNQYITDVFISLDISFL